MHVIFRKRAKKGKIFENLGKKITKFENILKKGRWLCAIIAHNKLLEKALTRVIIAYFDQKLKS